jgi:hypothetical protein
MSVLIQDSRTGIVTSTDLIGSYLDLFLRQNPNYSLVGIGTTSNNNYYPLLNDTTAQFDEPAVQSSFVFNPGLTRLGIGTQNPQATLHIIGNTLTIGVATATDFNSTSDVNLKTNIQTILNPIEKILQINGVSFNWKNNHEPAFGVIAQEVEKVIPELVHGDEPKTVSYNGLVGLLIECVKEQQKRIEELEKKIL